MSHQLFDQVADGRVAVCRRAILAVLWLRGQHRGGRHGGSRAVPLQLSELPGQLCNVLHTATTLLSAAICCEHGFCCPGKCTCCKMLTAKPDLTTEKLHVSDASDTVGSGGVEQWVCSKQEAWPESHMQTCQEDT